MTNAPLAERLRPQSLDDIIGQSHLLGKSAPIGRIIAQMDASNGFLPSMILHGEAGIGKTTLAHLLAKRVGRQFRTLSAVNAGVKELREALHTDDGLFSSNPVLFIDEIHRFNKAQRRRAFARC